ncbi:MAG TPA: PqqD family protein [Anaerolineaceae bacterium]|nr:PqqD family protein [Anaerolineaceae bacterium]
MPDLRKPKPVTDFQMEMIDGEAVILHPSSTKVLYTNPSGALVWDLCDGARTVDGIIAAIRETFPEAAEQIPGDVLEALEGFIAAGVMLWV